MILRTIAVASLVASLIPQPLSAAISDRNISVTIGEARIDQEAIFRLFHGIYVAAGISTADVWVAALEHKQTLRRAKIVDTIDTASENMPAGFRYFYYAGRDPKSEREIVWQSAKNVCVGAPGCQSNDEFIAAYSLAALDAYYVDGEPWRSLYAATTDTASRLSLGKAISKAIDEAADQARARGDADVAWIRQHIVISMSRTDAYTALRSVGMVAYNSAFNPGIPTRSPGGYSGCDFDDDTAAAWPYHGESIPKRSGECATFTANAGAPFPVVYVRFSGEFTIACGSDAGATLDFDTSDRVSKLNIEGFKWSCI